MSGPLVRITAQATLKPALQAWKLYLEDQGRSPNTIKSFLADLGLLERYLPADRAIGAITTDDLRRFFHWLEKERGVPCSPKSLARRITSVKAFFRWLHRYGVLAVDPAEKIPSMSVYSPLPQVLTEEEAAAALRAAEAMRRGEHPDTRPYTLLLLLLTTGIKKSECLGIHVNHIETQSPQGPYLFVRYASPSNRYKERKLPLTEEWLDAYQAYVTQYHIAGQLFSWSARALEYVLEDIGEAAGLEKHLSFDMCRWTYALRQYQQGVEPDLIRQRLGISRIQWREVFLKLKRLAGEEISAGTEGANQNG
ncbi:MAG: tyrosine-type recombinase/integrase [Anaerolineales bacterium]